MAASKRLRDAHNAHVRATTALERASAAMLAQKAVVQREQTELERLHQARFYALTALDAAGVDLQAAVAAEVTR